MKNKNTKKSWAEIRQEGKEKYIHKRSRLMAFSVLLGLTASNFYKGNLTFFHFLNLFLYFFVTYLGARMSTNYAWNRKEKKYHELIKKQKRDLSPCPVISR